MQIRVGYELLYTFPQPTPMILTLNIHYSRASDLVYPDHMLTNPSVPLQGYRDGFGNWCTRLVAPAGKMKISTNTVINDSGAWDVFAPDAQQVPTEQLPEEALVFLLGSRYCETDRLSDMAWRMFENGPTGWWRVKAICDFVHNHSHVRLRVREPQQDGLGRVDGGPRRVSRLRPPRDRALPLHEHPGPLLHGVPRRHRRRALGRTHGFCRLVRGLPRRHLVHVRSTQQRAPHRPACSSRAGVTRPMSRSTPRSVRIRWISFSVQTDQVFS